MTDNEPKGWEKEFDNGVALKIGKAGKSEGIQNVRREIKASIRDNFIPKAEVRKVVDASVKTPTLCGNCDLNGKLCKECYANRRANSALSDLLRSLHISEE